MTSPAAANLYLAQHLLAWEGKGYEIYNPHDKPKEELPVIYGFNNGGPVDFLSAQPIAQDGTPLGSHLCSHEGYMAADLGILLGSRPDRHEAFKKHYPDGYRMDFVPYAALDRHKDIQAAFDNNKQLQETSNV